MKRYRIAAILMIIHGGIMEIGSSLSLLPILLSDDTFEAEKYFSFIVPYLQENLFLMLIMGVIYGIMRIVGAVGLLRNRMWGLLISIINCIVSMALMINMLPAGIMDGILSCSALLLMLTQYYGKRKIIE